MKLKQLKSIISGLACSQGSYGRMKAELDESNKWNDLLKIVNKEKIKDPVDLVLFLER